MFDSIVKGYKKVDEKVAFLKEEKQSRYSYWEMFCLFIFIIFLPVMWTVVRNFVFKDYTSNYNSAIDLNDGSKIRVAISITVFVFQIAIPFIGMLVQAFLSRKKMYKDGIMFLYLFVFLPTLINLLFSSEVSEILNLIINLLLIGLYCFVVKPFTTASKALFSIKGFLYFLTILAIVFSLAIVMNILGALSTSGQSANQKSIESSTQNAFLIIQIILIAPIIEELFVRRIVFVVFNKNWFAYLMTSFYFAFIHIELAGDWDQFISYFLPSLALSSGLWFCKNCLPGVGAHMLFNIIGYFG